MSRQADREGFPEVAEAYRVLLFPPICGCGSVGRAADL